MKEYKYYLTIRPLSIGTHPIDGLLRVDYKTNTATYNRELTNKEMLNFSMKPTFPFSYERGVKFGKKTFIEKINFDGRLLTINGKNISFFEFIKNE